MFSSAHNEIMESLRLQSFNCKNLKSSLPEIKSLCHNSDIVLLQETWLAPNDLMLNEIHPDFYGKGVSAIEIESSVLRGRAYGGIAILWRKALSSISSPLLFDDTRIMGIEIRTHVKVVIQCLYACL